MTYIAVYGIQPMVQQLTWLSMRVLVVFSLIVQVIPSGGDAFYRVCAKLKNPGLIPGFKLNRGKAT